MSKKPGHRCITHSFSYGYDSCKDKYHFFIVSKNDIELQQWTKAILKKNFLIKPRQVVCERNFHEEDIIRERIMANKIERILAEVGFLSVLSLSMHL